MYLKTLPIEEIHPYENNPRINDQAVEPVMKSIQKDGYRARIIVDTNGVIIAGHTRYKAMQNLGWEEVEVWIADDMTDEQIRDYRVRDNYTAGFADWDYELLAKEIEDLDFDMGQFMTQPEEYEEPPEPEAVEDNFDPEEDIPEETDIVQGDLFVCGSHRILCGDSTNIDDVLRLMDGAKADLFLTDPPYNIDYEYKQNNLARFRANKRVLSGNASIDNDAMGTDDFYNFLMEVFFCADKVMHEGAAFYIWHADLNGHLFREAVLETGWNLKEILIWVKNNFTLSRQDYHYRHEPCIYGWKKGAGHYFIDKRNQQTVFDDKIDVKKLSKQEMRDLIEQLLYKHENTVLYEDKPMFNDIHPTMKPIKLMARLVANSSKPGWKVLDLFGGSGSTMMACEQLGRNCYSMEVAPKYVSAMLKRWHTFTGEQVYRLEEGQMIPYDVEALQPR